MVDDGSLLHWLIFRAVWRTWIFLVSFAGFNRPKTAYCWRDEIMMMTGLDVLNSL